MGLYNLGNTCYMNSPLQCLVNIRQFHEYYVKDKTHQSHLNLHNDYGYGGELVLGFADLIQNLWNGDQVVVPRQFRHLVGKLNEDYACDDQQDAQEFINFMVDGLHEDTNLRVGKQTDDGEDLASDS